VQVEFTGAGSLSLVLDESSGPAAPLLYRQPGVSYMKGHAGLVVTGADETTHVTVFSVGRATAFDPTGAFNLAQPVSATNDPARNGSPLFQDHPASDYDGIADLAFIAISSTDGKFGGVRTGDASFFGTNGYTGLYAPGVEFTGPVNLGNINAHNEATPVLQIGAADLGVAITGGDLKQDNARAIQVSGFTRLNFVAGATSNNGVLPAQTNQAHFEQNGRDITATIVVSRQN